MFPCKTKMFIWGTSQRMFPAVAVQLTNLHLLHAPLFFLFGLFSTVGAPSWISTSCLMDLFCCLVYDRGFSQWFIEQCQSPGEPEVVGILGRIPKCSWFTSCHVGVIVFKFLQVSLDRMIFCASICWTVFHVTQRGASALQVAILIMGIPLAWSRWSGWGGMWTY